MRQFRSSIPWLKYLLFTLHNQGYPWLCKTRFRLMVSLYRVGVEPTGFQRMISVHRTSHILRLSLSQERPDPDFLSGNGEAGWVSRQTVKNLLALAKAANRTMMPDSRQFTVIFDRSNLTPVETQQVMPFTYPDDDNQYLLILRLLTFQPT